MSHSSQSHYPTAAHAGRAVQPRAQSAAAVSRHLHRSHGDYTLVHGGRQVRIGPVAFWIVVGTLVIMARVVDRHRNLFRLPRRRAHPPDRPPGRNAIRLRGPHRRIARAGRPHHQPAIARPGTIRAEAQRAAATADGVGAAHARALGGDRRTTGSIRPRAQRIAEPPATSRSKPSPINDTVIFMAPPDREARLESRELPASMTRIASRSDAGGLDGMLARISPRSTRSSGGRPRR